MITYVLLCQRFIDIALLQFDYIAFNCPEGYVFEGTNNATHYAICYNWNYIYLFDPEIMCVRKLLLNLKIFYFTYKI